MTVTTLTLSETEQKPSAPLKPLPPPPASPQRSYSAITERTGSFVIASETTIMRESLNSLLKKIFEFMDELIESTSPSDTTFEKTIMIGQIVSYLNKVERRDWSDLCSNYNPVLH